MREDIVLGSVTLLMTVLGTIISLHSPEKLVWKLLYGFVFLALGVIGMIYVIKQSNASEASNQKLSDALGNLSSSTRAISSNDAVKYGPPRSTFIAGRDDL